MTEIPQRHIHLEAGQALNSTFGSLTHSLANNVVTARAASGV